MASFQGSAIDYSTKENQAMYRAATEPLDIKFDGSSTGLKLFIDQITTRAAQYGWNTTFGNLLTKYGEVSMTDLKTKAQTYLAQEGRDAQNSDMIYNCLWRSITSDVMAKVTTEVDRYTVTIQGEAIYDGLLFLKIIIDQAYTNVRTTAATLRSNLSSLDTFMTTHKDSNIETFNAYVKETVIKLNACGETTNDLLVNLFKAYKLAKDEPFTRWVAYKRTEWLEGTLQLPNDGYKLMDLALGYYKDAMANKEWSKDSAQDSQILALKAEIMQLKQQRQEPYAEANRNNSKSDDEWKKKAPKKNEAHTKKVNNREWHWCPSHKAWVRHKPEDCKGLGWKPTPSPVAEKEHSTESTNDTKKFKLTKALEALVSVTEEEQDEE